jgi:hypothetical protein
LEADIRQAALESTESCWWPEEFQKLDLGVFQNFSKRLFDALDVSRMKRSIKTRANPYVMQRVLEVILRRLTDPSHNPPLRIAVFGGSVTQGCWSHQNIYGLHANGIQCHTECTWTAKLERLANHILGKETIVVKNYALAGSDSDIGATFLEYNIWPEKDYSGRDFDVIIASFTSNDAQAPPQMKEFIYDSMQKFNRIAMGLRLCSDLPLVIQLEDTMLESLINMNVEKGRQVNQDMVETATWTETMSVSYPDAIRTFMYANPSNKLLHEFGGLHPGQGFHTGVAWVMAWNLLVALTDSCDAHMLPQRNDPEPRAGYPLPILSKNLKGPEVASIWKTSSLEKEKLCSSASEGGECVYRWIASRYDARTRMMVQRAISKVLVNNVGWKAVGYPIKKPRRTWFTETVNSTFTIQLDNLAIPIDRMLVLYLRSYGKQWQSSRLLLVVEGRSPSNSTTADDWKELYQSELSGIHDVETSINYSHRINFALLQAGSSLRATFTLVGGSRFQINGMALCASPRLAN